MPTVAEQTATLENHLSLGEYSEAYNYIANQISGDPNAGIEIIQFADGSTLGESVFPTG